MKALTLLCVSVLGVTAVLGNVDKLQVERNLDILEGWLGGVPDDVFTHVTAVQGQLFLVSSIGRDGLFRRIDMILNHYISKSGCDAELKQLKQRRDELSLELVSIKDHYVTYLQKFLDNYKDIVKDLTDRKNAIKSTKETVCIENCPDLVDKSYFLLVDDGTDLFNVMDVKNIVAETVSHLADSFYAANVEADQIIKAVMNKCQ